MGGICFRDRHGFCSTGSQISWLPTTVGEGNGGHAASYHFYTGASDPLLTPYKLFTFDNEDGCCDQGTNKLWNLWRSRALSRTTVKASLANELSSIEEEGLSIVSS